jgi:hypothetical protein
LSEQKCPLAHQRLLQSNSLTFPSYKRGMMAHPHRLRREPKPAMSDECRALIIYSAAKVNIYVKGWLNIRAA